MTTADWLLLLHLVSAFAMVAGVALATAGMLAARRERAPGELALLAGVARGGLRTLLAPGAVAALVFGLLLASELDYSMGAAWLSTAFVLWIVLAVVSEAVVGRAARRVGDEARASEATAAAAAARAPLAVAGLVLMNLLTLALIVVMVWRPGS